MDDLAKKIKAKEYAKKYREIHKEDLNRRRMETYWRNLDKAKEYTKKYYQDHKKELTEATRLYYKENSEARKQYSKDYRESHKESVSNSQKEWWKNNKKRNSYFDKFPEKRLEYERNRRARIRGSGGKFTSEEWKRVCDFYGNKCLSCGKDDEKLTLDHVIPLKAGGKHSIENIQPLCGHCNYSKGTKIIDYRNGKVLYE